MIPLKLITFILILYAPKFYNDTCIVKITVRHSSENCVIITNRTYCTSYRQLCADKKVYCSKGRPFNWTSGGKRDMSTNTYKSTLLQRRKTTLGIRFIGILLIGVQIVPPQIVQINPVCFVEAYLPANYQSTGKFNRENSFSSTLHGLRNAQEKSGMVRTRLRLNNFNGIAFNVYFSNEKRKYMFKNLI